MKNLVKNSTLVLLALTAFFTTSAFMTVNNSTKQTESFMTSDNYCVLYVKTSYGSAAKRIKVSTDVSGGVSCIGGRSFHTNSDGKVNLKWTSGCYLKKIYVDGKGYDINYKNGETYYLTMK